MFHAHTFLIIVLMIYARRKASCSVPASGSLFEKTINFSESHKLVLEVMRSLIVCLSLSGKEVWVARHTHLLGWISHCV